jgi:hypothetical protein
MTRAFLRRTAGLLAGVLLSAQMAIAAYACPGLALPDEPSGAAATIAPASPPMANCDDMAGAMDPAAPNLCAEHCKYGQQSDQAATLNVPAAVMSALYVIQPAPLTASPPRPTAAILSALVAASPPHAIAHCVYRI